MTLGDLRKLTEHLPDSAPVQWNVWRRGCPDFHELDTPTDIKVQNGKVVIDASQFQEDPE